LARARTVCRCIARRVDAAPGFGCGRKRVRKESGCTRHRARRRRRRAASRPAAGGFAEPALAAQLVEQTAVAAKRAYLHIYAMMSIYGVCRARHPARSIGPPEVIRSR